MCLVCVCSGTQSLVSLYKSMIDTWEQLTQSPSLIKTDALSQRQMTRVYVCGSGECVYSVLCTLYCVLCVSSECVCVYSVLCGSGECVYCVGVVSDVL